MKSVDIPPPGRRHAERIAWRKAWSAAMFDGSFAGPSWPREYGGMDLPFRLQIAHSEELGRARVPKTPGNGPSMAGPTIIKFGTDEQRRRWLRPSLRGDEIWAQGFSEPGAGSDLPSLRTTAVRDGSDYVVNGQKVWNSSADVSAMAFVLVRTGSTESRQNGISYLLVDLRVPGVPSARSGT